MEHLKKIPVIWHETDFKGHHSGFITTSIKKTKKGYNIKRFSNYVTVININLEVLHNGFSKATIKVDKNYHAKYQYTMYFDEELKEVKNRKEWLTQQNITLITN